MLISVIQRSGCLKKDKILDTEGHGYTRIKDCDAKSKESYVPANGVLLEPKIFNHRGHRGHREK